MHVLRSTYLPTYTSLMGRPPCSSDLFSYFTALKVRENSVMMDDTELLLEREESLKDLLDLMQPRSRLEDLVHYYGVREGVSQSLQSCNSISSGTPSRLHKGSIGPAPLPFTMLSISFSPRKVGLVLTTTGRKRTISEVARARDEKLEFTAKTLAKQLKVWVNDV